MNLRGSILVFKRERYYTKVTPKQSRLLSPPVKMVQKAEEERWDVRATLQNSIGILHIVWGIGNVLKNGLSFLLVKLSPLRHISHHI